MAESKLQASKYTENYTRLSILLIDGGAVCLRNKVVQKALEYHLADQKVSINKFVPQTLDQEQFSVLFPGKEIDAPSVDNLDHVLIMFLLHHVFEQKHIPRNIAEAEARESLTTFLKTEGIDCILKRRKDKLQKQNSKKRFIHRQQWDKLFPEEGSINLDNLDITLLNVLIRNLFNVTPSSGHWDNEMPKEDDVNLGDDILRIGLFRNQLAHLSSVNIDDEQFTSIWTSFTDVLRRLGGIRLRQLAAELKENPVDATLAKDCQDIIEQWCQEEKHINERLDELQENQIKQTKFLEEAMDNKIQRLGDRLSQKKTEKTLKVTVHTGNVNGAGTDANVFLTIYGTEGSAVERALSKSRTNFNKFERNKTDEFDINIDTALGEIHKIKIRHDNANVRSDWYLDWITILDTTSDKEYTFRCEKWLAKDIDDKVTERTLYTESFTGKKENPSIRRRIVSRQESIVDEPDTSSKTIPVIIEISIGNDENYTTTWEGIWVIIEGDQNVTNKVYLKDLYAELHKPLSVYTFLTQVADVGNLAKVLVGYDSKVAVSATYLKDMSVDFPTKGIRNGLQCKRWLARTNDRDNPLEFQIKKASIVTYRPLVQYDIKIKTGYLQDAGTDTDITMILFGLKGSTSPYKFKSTDRFERDEEDHVQLLLEDVGQLRKIRFTCSGKGRRPDWYLEKVEIENMTTLVTTRFRAGKWFSKKGSLTHEIPPTVQDKEIASATSYKVTVKTSDIRGAGTDANVYIILFGTNGESNTIHLKKSENYKNPFERNHIDAFMILDVLSLGELYKVRIWHDDKGLGADWHLTYVDVEEMTHKKLYSFRCDKWLSTSEDDGQIIREITCGDPVDQSKGFEHTSNVYEVEIEATAMFVVTVKEGLSIKVMGDEDSFIHRITSASECESNGNKITFLEISKCIGKIQNATVFEENSQCGSVQTTYTQITVTHASTGNKYILTPSGSQKNKTERGFTLSSVEESLMTVVRNLQIIRYDIKVYTGNRKYAGTDANVSIIIFGYNGNTGVRPLPRKRRNAFKRNQVDSFIIKAVDLGTLEKVQIQHDGSGMGAGWFLDRIEVQSDDKVSTEFPCYNWLEIADGEKLCSLDLLPRNRSLIQP